MFKREFSTAEMTEKKVRDPVSKPVEWILDVCYFVGKISSGYDAEVNRTRW